MKFHIEVAGAGVPNFTDCRVQYDAQYASAAVFTVRQPAAGPWYENLAKIQVFGRELESDDAHWSFEEATHCLDWGVRTNAVYTPLTMDAQNTTQSAKGQASCAFTVPANATSDFCRQFGPAKYNGLTFWGWFTFTAPAAGSLLYLTPYARSASEEWQGQRTQVLGFADWRAIGFRVQPTAANADAPMEVIEFGWHIEPGAAAFTMLADSIHLCGRSYPEGIQLPPFPAGDRWTGSALPWQKHTCGKWDTTLWADDAHLLATDAGWCVEGIRWDYFQWADEKNPKPDDATWS